MCTLPSFILASSVPRYTDISRGTVPVKMVDNGMSLWNDDLAPGLADMLENSVRGVYMSVCYLGVIETLVK